MLLTAGAAVAGIGFLVFGRMADRQSASRVVGMGVLVLVGLRWRADGAQP